MKSKSGQVTIWIIVGIVVIAIVALFVVLFRTGIIPSPVGPSVDKNPNSFLRECMQDKVLETVRIIGPQGGTLEPTLYKRFMFVEEGVAYNVSYLCYNQNDYLPCINQNPVLISSMEKEIKYEIMDSVEECFDSLTANYRRAGYSVDVSGTEYEVKLKEGEVVVELDREINLGKGDQSSVLKNFKISFPSKIYDLGVVAIEVIRGISEDCSFDHLDYTRQNPKFEIEKYVDDDTSKIYTIRVRENNKDMFRFAVRGRCNQ